METWGKPYSSLWRLVVLAMVFTALHNAHAVSNSCFQTIHELLDDHPPGAGDTPDVIAGFTNIARLEPINGRSSFKVQTALVPAELPGHITEVRDAGAKPFSQHWPEKFVISDASSERPMMYLDLSRGSRLSQMVDSIVDTIPADVQADPEKLVLYMRDNTTDELMNTFMISVGVEPRPRLDSDAETVFKTFEHEPLNRAGNHTIAPLRTPYPTLPFEYYLAGGDSKCVQNSLLVSIILERFGVLNRYITGISMAPDGSIIGGHAWIQLADGRWLDPTWHLLEKPGTFFDGLDGQSFGVSRMVLNHRSPYLYIRQ